MKSSMKKPLSIVLILAMVLCIVFASAVSAFAAYQDGTYNVGVSCSGGSGRGGVSSATVTVSGGSITSVALTMSSGNYDYCYDPVTGATVTAPAGSGNSVFYINYPGTVFDFTADTTAMSAPHEITYTVALDLSGIPQIPGSDPSPAPSYSPGTGDDSAVFYAAAAIAFVMIAAVYIENRKYHE